jgi:hypothetical protein
MHKAFQDRTLIFFLVYFPYTRNCNMQRVKVSYLIQPELDYTFCI